MTSGRCAGALRRGLGSNAASSSILEPSTNHSATSRCGVKNKDITKAGAAHKRRPPTVFVVTLRPRPGTDGVREVRQ